MLYSSDIYLRALEASDLTQRYLSWLNDPSVCNYLETRFVPQSMSSLQKYYQQYCDDPNSPWFAICLRTSGVHIGNIKLGPINWYHRKADISLFIGDRLQWGKGFATQSISCLTNWSFEVLDLYKLSAGIYSDNIGSIKAFERAGFTLDATLKDDVLSNGSRLDVFRYRLLKNDWLMNQ